MDREQQIWQSKFLGKLDEESPFVNKNGDVQFKIEIVSNTPSDFPLNEKRVTGFSNDLTLYGYTHQLTDTSGEKVDKLIEFLQNSYLIFSVRESEHADEKINKKYYNAFALKRIEFNELYENTTFYPIPFYFSNKGDIEKITKKVSNAEYIGRNDAVSLNKDDYPPFIIIGEKEDTISIKEIEEFHIIGPIMEMQYKEEYGVKYSGEDSISSISKSAEKLKEFYISEEGVIFIPIEIVDDIESELSEAPQIVNSEVSNLETIRGSEKVEDVDELDFLTLFEKVCKSKGLIYTKQDLFNFHTAIKTQSFVILSGMSGTGKSQLIQCYHQALNGIEERMLFVPVRPFWQDDSDLLGYLDTLNGIYRPGDSGLVDFIIESSKNDKDSYFVCLDEMNLARVEHYFSQFLSILERDPNNRIIQLYNPKMDGRVYNKNEYPPELKLGENLFFVGTVNTDESTYQFSDKVLDRANVINLSLENFIEIKVQQEQHENEKRKDRSLEGKKEVEEIDSINTFSKLQGMKKEDKRYKLNDRELGLLWDLHKCINKVSGNIGIGMRIVNQIEQYLMNLPESSFLTRKDAFDIQIAQRVFTKLRGSEGQLIHLVGLVEDDELDDSEILDIFNAYSDVSQFEKSKNKLKLISKELLEYGHTI